MSVIRTIPTLRPRDMAATAKKVAPLMPEVVPGAQVVAGKFMRRLAGRALARIADNVMPEVCANSPNIAVAMFHGTECRTGYEIYAQNHPKLATVPFRCLPAPAPEYRKTHGKRCKADYHACPPPPLFLPPRWRAQGTAAAEARDLLLTDQAMTTSLGQGAAPTIEGVGGKPRRKIVG